MPSTLNRNALGSGLLHSLGYDLLELWLPPEDDDAICTAQTVAVGALNIDGAGVKSLVANAKCTLQRPAPPVFTFSQTADRCVIEITGSDQWGRKVVWIVAKDGNGVIQKTLTTLGAERIPPMWRIDSIRLTAATVATGTVAVGFSYASGNAQSIALPLSFPNVAAMQGLTKLVYFDQTEGGLWTAGPYPGFVTTTATMTDVDAQRGVMPLTLGTTVASATAATAVNANFTGAGWVAGTFTLTKTAAFTFYVYVPGDTITIVSGTGAAAGSYIVASRVSADAITLRSSPGVDAADYVFRINKFIIGKTSGFTGYTFRPGDTISLTGGTGITTGAYPIVAKTSANTLVIQGDPGGTNAADVTYTLTAMPTRWSKLLLLLDPDVISNQ
jgi:hypothetical protein